MLMIMPIVAFLAIALPVPAANQSRPAMSATQVTGPAFLPNTYHVSPGGNDTNPGTYVSPLPSIQPGVNKPYPGDMVTPLAVRGKVHGGGNPLATIGNADPFSATRVAARVIGPEPSGLVTYYVSPSGRDTNPGTYESPLLTIQAGINKAYPGDIVMVMAGTYKEQISFPRSGTAGSPIVLRGAMDEQGQWLTTIDNTAPIGRDFWTPAPERGTGIYKRVGFTPDIMLWNGEQIMKICVPWMRDTGRMGVENGFKILSYPPDTFWNPAGHGTTPFWDDVELLYGCLGDTTWIRERNYADPDTLDLRAAEDSTVCVKLHDNSNIIIERLKIRGAILPVEIDNSDSCVVQDCYIENGNYRIQVDNGSAYNNIKRNTFTRGYLSFGQFGEFVGGHYPPVAIRRNAMYTLGKYLEGAGSSLDQGVRFYECGPGNELDSNEMSHGSVAVSLGAGERNRIPNVRIYGNTISYFSSIGIYIWKGVDTTYAYDNLITHCDLAFRIGEIGGASDTTRNGFIFRNRMYNDTACGGMGVKFHNAAYNFVHPPDFWFYHNSWAGGYGWAYPVGLGNDTVGPGDCKLMHVVNDIFSTHHFAPGTNPKTDSTPDIFMGFDYNFCGGRYNPSRSFRWAFRDRHNQWFADTIAGSLAHQVWDLGSEPDWIVPDTSTAYQSGLDLSDSFELGDSTYGPLPGMTPAYFTGVKPNLGAIQSTSYMGMPQRDPGRGSITQLPELTFAPNPATGRCVMARCAIPTGKIGKLTVRDVVGRTVKSITQVPSGTTQIDLRGFAPGVYIAALDAAGPPVFGKLIITAQ